MAVTNFLVSSLPDYVKNNEDLLIASFGLPNNGTRRYIGIQTGIKKSAYLNYLGFTGVFQDGSSCGFNPLDEIALGQKEIEVATIKEDGEICPETLLGKWGEWKVRVAATENELPFEAYIMNALLDGIRKGIETQIWVGDTSGTDLIDGFLTQFAADANVVTVTLTGVTGAYDAVKAVYFGMSAEALDRGGIIFVDPIVFRALINDVTALNMFHYNPGNANLDEFILPGTDVRVVKTPGLAGTNAIVGTFGDNLVYGTDMENDNELVDLWWSEDNRVFRYQVKWNMGVAYHFSEHIAFGVMDDAPTPIGTCPCAAPASEGE
jgi:hypothetical protein